MNLLALLTLGFFLGMRHATDPDHVAAVSTIVAREKSLRAAAPIGLLWGVGHALTILLVGGAIVLFGVVIPPRLGLGMELSVGAMLVVLGASSLGGVLRDARRLAGHSHGAHDHPPHVGGPGLRPLLVGIVHGLAGSAAVALLVLATVRDPRWAVAYLVLFGVGTIAGMLLITVALAVPLVLTARRFVRVRHGLGFASAVLSVALGAFMVYEIGFTRGLFTDRVEWTPR